MRLATPPRRGTRRTHAGLTLIELIVAITVAAILFTWAIPSFQQFSARNEVAAEVMRVKNALLVARSNAISQRTTTTLCPSTDMIQCQTGGSSSGIPWKEPLVIFSGRGAPGDPIAFNFGRSKVAALIYRNDDRPVRFNSLGFSTGYNGTFTICGDHDLGASVVLSNSGRIRSSKTNSC